jgi:uncharacterized protein (TIGR03435 family)
MRLFLSVFLAASALAQNSAPPAFDAASVKINPQFSLDNRATTLNTVDTTPGSLTIRNFNLAMIVAWAHHVQRPQVSGPAWIESQRYDIFAKAGRTVSEGELRQMLQTLLVERFKLAVHRESRRMDVLAMLVPKAGHKMAPSQIEGPVQNRQDAVRGMLLEGVDLGEFANELSPDVEVPVVDMTGLTGRFDFTWNTEKYVSAMRARVMAEGKPISDSDACDGDAGCSGGEVAGGELRRSPSVHGAQFAEQRAETREGLYDLDRWRRPGWIGLSEIGAGERGDAGPGGL